MGRKLVNLGVLAFGALLITNASMDVEAKRMMPSEFGGFRGVSNFRFLDRALSPANTKKLGASAVTLAGSNIVTVPAGSLVIDEDSGRLVLTDETGAKLDSLSIRPGASQVAYDGRAKIAYVSDRLGDRIWKVAVGAESLSHEGRVRTPSEPYGLAITPDGKTLLVTTVADRTLVAYETETMHRRWTLEIPAEARGIAIRPDGKEAVITHLSTGTVTHLDLEKRTLQHTALNVTPADNSANEAFPMQQRSQLRGPNIKNTGAIRTDEKGGLAFARSAFAATYLPGGMTAIAYNESTPNQASGGRERVSTYGGGTRAPVEHRIAFIGKKSGKTIGRPVARAEIAAHSPRALAYDAGSDILYLAAVGNDQIVAIAEASMPSAHHLWTRVIPISGTTRCGPTGIAVARDGSLRAFCSMSRLVAVIRDNPSMTANRSTQSVVLGKALTRSRLSASAMRGKEVFFKGGDFRLSTRGAMACGTCHPEGRTDGLSWRIEGHSLQTPLLIGGRLMGTHPFKWDGKDSDLTASLNNTIRRLGGSGVTKEQVVDLQAFFKTLPRPRTPTLDRIAVARGEKLFRGKTLGCAKCHSGKQYTNGKSYDIADDLEKVDTPSLIGLAASAPYYHDGSAADLRALLMNKGDIHDMGGIDRIEQGQLGDLIAFLKTL